MFHELRHNRHGPIIQAGKAGVAHRHVEQDHSPDAIKSIQQSIKYLGCYSSLGFQVISMAFCVSFITVIAFNLFANLLCTI